MSSVLLPTKAYAAEQTGPWYNQSFTQWSEKVFDEGTPNEIFGERYTFAQVTWIVHSLLAILTGPGIVKCANLYINGDLTAVGDCLKGLGPLGSNASQSGPIDGLAMVTNSMLNTHVASGTQYISTGLSNLKIIPEAQAQEGVGFNVLQPIQVVWKASRNMSYALLIIVFIAMSFAIMFRVKISPQAVVTIQSALPRIITALVLITFSYAIAGLLIDLAYVVIGLISVLVKSGGNEISYESSIYVFNQMNAGNGLWSIVIGFLFLVILISIGAIAALGASVATIVLTPLGIGAAIIAIILVILMLTIIFRLFWTLLKTTVNIIILVIAGPFIILLGVLPNSGGATSWMRNLIANTMVYPTVAILLLLSHYLFWGWFGSGSILYTLRGPLVFLNTFAINQDTLGGSKIIGVPGFPMQSNIIGFFGAFALLFLVPSAAEIVKSFIEGKAFNYGGAIGQTFGPARGIATTGGMYGAAEFLNKRETAFKLANSAGTSIPAYIQTARRILGLKAG